MLAQKIAADLNLSKGLLIHMSETEAACRNTGTNEPQK
jgi:hypothetical protein